MQHPQDEALAADAYEQQMAEVERLLLLGLFDEACCYSQVLLLSWSNQPVAEQERIWVCMLQAFVGAGRHEELEGLVTMSGGPVALPLKATLVWVLLLLEAGDVKRSQQVCQDCFAGWQASGEPLPEHAEAMVSCYALDVLSAGSKDPAAALTWLDEARTQSLASLAMAPDALAGLQQQVQALLRDQQAKAAAATPRATPRPGASSSGATAQPGGHARSADNRGQATRPQQSEGTAGVSASGRGGEESAHGGTAGGGGGRVQALAKQIGDDVRTVISARSSGISGSGPGSGVLAWVSARLAAALAQLKALHLPGLPGAGWLVVLVVVLYAAVVEARTRLPHFLSFMSRALKDALAMGLQLNPNPHAGVQAAVGSVARR